MKLKYLVTGTGRCGTVYMARFLTNLGISCGHEAIFDWAGLQQAEARLNGKIKIETSLCSRHDHLAGHDIEKWFDPANLIAEASYMAAPYTENAILDGIKVIHLLRNPIQVLSSWVLDVHFFHKNNKNLEEYREFIYYHVPQIAQEKTEIEMACRYLIEWNKKIENSSREKIVVRVEDFPFVGLINFLGDDVKDTENLFSNVKINSWRRRNRDLEVREIQSGNTKDEFIHMIEKYGYKYKNRPLSNELLLC